MNLRVIFDNYRNRLIWIASVLVFLTVSLLLYLRPGQGYAPDIPDPNGYQHFLLAIEAFQDHQIGSYHDLDTTETLVRDHSKVIHHVLAGLAEKCQVPPRNLQRLANGNYVFENEAAQLKAIQHLLIARAKFFELKDQMDESYRAYEDAYLFAHESGRGGIAFDYVTEISRKALVLRALKPMIPRFSSDQCKDMLGLIDTIENDPQNSLDLVLLRNRDWADHVYGKGWRLSRLKRIIFEVIQTKSLAPITAFKMNLKSKTALYESGYVAPVRGALLDRLNGFSNEAKISNQ